MNALIMLLAAMGAFIWIAVAFWYLVVEFARGGFHLGILLFVIAWPVALPILFVAAIISDLRQSFRS